MSYGLRQLRLRFQIEKFLERVGAKISGAGTDLTTGIMDISFNYPGSKGTRYSITIEEMSPAQHPKTTSKISTHLTHE